MKRITAISYRLGRSTVNMPKPSIKPIIRLFKAFKQGRKDGKANNVEPVTFQVD